MSASTWKPLPEAMHAKLSQRESEIIDAFQRWCQEERRHRNQEPAYSSPKAQKMLRKIYRLRALMYGDCPNCGGHISSEVGVCTAQCYRDTHGGKMWGAS